MPGKKELVSYCGLYCGDCVKFKGNISKMAKELSLELSKENFKKVATSLKHAKNYDEFDQILKILADMECKDGCRQGGGTPDCEIRHCCQEKGFETCADCDEFQYCPELAGIPVLQCGIVSYVKVLERIKELGMDKWLAEKD